MITLKQAQEIAQNELDKLNPNQDLVILDKFVEFDKGWIFFYETRKYVETGDDHFSLFGNGPIAVGAENGKVLHFGTGYDIDYYIQQSKQSL